MRAFVRLRRMALSVESLARKVAGHSYNFHIYGHESTDRARRSRSTEP
ncbi:MAG: hypothetical protein WCO77_03340 [bacterium]